MPYKYFAVHNHTGSYRVYIVSNAKYYSLYVMVCITIIKNASFGWLLLGIPAGICLNTKPYPIAAYTFCIVRPFWSSLVHKSNTIGLRFRLCALGIIQILLLLLSLSLSATLRYPRRAPRIYARNPQMTVAITRRFLCVQTEVVFSQNRNYNHRRFDCVLSR